MLFRNVEELPISFHRNHILWWTHKLRFQRYVEQKCKEAALTLDLSRTRTGYLFNGTVPAKIQGEGE